MLSAADGKLDIQIGCMSYKRTMVLPDPVGFDIEVVDTSKYNDSTMISDHKRCWDSSDCRYFQFEHSCAILNT